MEEIIENSNYELVTYLAKKTRLENNLIIDAVSYHLSKSTVSNIENRRGNASSKAIAQYLTNLGLGKNDLVDQLHEIEVELQDLEYQIELAHIFLDEKKLEEAKTILDNIQVVDYHPLATQVKYMSGRYFYLQNDFTRAKQIFVDTINLYQKNNYDQPDLLPTCYNTLSACYYYEEDPASALHYANAGISHLNTRTHPDVKYLLLVNKVLNLIVLDQSELAFELTNQIWDQIHTVQPMKVRLNLYKFRAKLLKKAKQYKQAMDCAKQGLRIARQNKDRNRTFSLLIVLGTIYLDLTEYQKAKTCFRTVITFEDTRYPRRLTDAHVYLGILHALQEEWSQAESQLAAAKIICEEHQIEIRRWIKMIIVYGNILQQQSKFTEAVSLYNEAHTLTEQKQGLLPLQYDVLFHLLRCYQASGDIDNFNRMNMRFFQLVNQLHTSNEVQLYESAGPSFTPR